MGTAQGSIRTEFLPVAAPSNRALKPTAVEVRGFYSHIWAGVGLVWTLATFLSITDDSIFLCNAPCSINYR